MKKQDNIFIHNPKYISLLGKQQTLTLLELFNEIENGKYNKEEIHSINIKGLKHPVLLRSIRADMQSFINTFIDPYLEQKPYINKTKFVIDAGANIGYTAILFANWWPEAQIISIEPDKENYELTLKNTANYPNIKVLHAALWSKTARLQIEAGQEDGFVVKEIRGKKEQVKSENSINGISINEILKKYHKTKIDFLKMNVEGSEKEIFSENYHDWLPYTKTMLIELHDGKNAGCSKTVFNTTNQYNFSVAETANYGVLFTQESIYRKWYAKWYKDEIYIPNINKKRFPKFYLDKEK